MPIIIVLLLAVMVATYGFWDTFQAVLGAIGVIVLLCLLGALTIAALAAMFLRR
ncbi:MAG: hypothetical protein ACREDO_05315 [Methyloceanibacter sp.]